MEHTDLNSVTYEDIIEMEATRQRNNIELIASENFCSDRVRQACGSILTNKYAEGYPGKRYYGGCEYIDMIEQKAINDVCKLFGCKFANVQPHCGSSANQAVFRALLEQGDTVLSMDLGAGGHLSHGHKMSFSGQDYNIISYGLDDNGIIDYEDIENKIYRYNPAMLIVGASSYSRTIDFERIARIIEDYYYKTGDKPIYMVDMAHIAGLVAGGQHPSPIGWADVVTSTTHKTLRGPRGGLILTNDEEIIKKINKTVFPGIQGGPLEHIIAGKGICFEEANTEEFKKYTEQIVKNSKAFAKEFLDNGWRIVSGGTDNHMFILDVYHSQPTMLNVTGKDAEVELDKINITVNKNQIHKDALSPMVSSGIRMGTPAMTTKGFKEADFVVLAHLIMDFLTDVNKMKTEGKKINYDKYKSLVEKLIK